MFFSSHSLLSCRSGLYRVMPGALPRRRAPAGGSVRGMALPVPVPLQALPSDRPQHAAVLAAALQGQPGSPRSRGHSAQGRGSAGPTPLGRTAGSAQRPGRRLPLPALGIGQPGWSNDRSWKGKSDLHLGPGPDVSRSRKQPRSPPGSAGSVAGSVAGSAAGSFPAASPPAGLRQAGTGCEGSPGEKKARGERRRGRSAARAAVRAPARSMRC